MKKILAVLLCLMFGGAAVPKSTPAAYAAGNVALGKTAFASSRFNESYTEVMVNDGDYNTSWSMGDEILTGKKGGYEYIAVDLGRTYDIQKIVVYSRQDFDQPADRQGWVIQVSNDPEFNTTVDVGRRLDAGEFKSATELTLTLDEVYRYVRVASPTYFVVAEIEVYGEEVDAGGIKTFKDIEEERYVGPINLLQYLGLVEGISNTEFGPYHLLTRAEAVKLAVGLADGGADVSRTKKIFEDVPKEHWANPYVAAGVELGLISLDQKFRPDSYVTTTEFLKMIEGAMGYQPLMEAKGGYPVGVSVLAGELKLMRGINADYDKPINRVNVAMVLYNALTADALTIQSLDANLIGDYRQDQTLLESKFSLQLKTGVVTANQVTTLTAARNAGKNTVEIDHRSYYDTTEKVQSMLGQNIIYLTETDQEEQILLAWRDTAKTTLTRVRSDELESVSGRSIRYTKDGVSESISWREGVSVLKNGVAFPAWTADDFMPPDGYLELIDSNNDAEADVIFIYDPLVIICDSASEEDGRVAISGRNGAEIKIQTPARLSVLINGKSGSVSELSDLDVVYAYLSENENCLLVEASTNRMEAAADAVSSDCVEIQGKAYDLSQYFIQAQKEGTLFLEPAVQTTFLFDNENRLVWIDQNVKLGANAVIGLLLGYQAQGLDTLKIKLFNQSGQFEIVSLSNTVTIDGVRYSGNQAAELLEQNWDQYANLFACYRTNQENQIFELDTEIYNPATEPESQMIKADINIQYDAGSYDFLKGVNGIYDRNMMILPITADTPAFSIPTVGGVPAQGDSYSQYYRSETVGTIFPDSNPIKAPTAYYGQDEFGYPSFAVWYSERQPSTADIAMVIDDEYAPGYVVQKMVSCVDENGNEAKKLYGYQLVTGKEEEVIIPQEIQYFYDSYLIQQEHTDWLDGRWMLVASALEANSDESIAYRRSIAEIRCGDIIRCQMGAGQAIAVERVFDYGRGIIDSYTSADGSFYNAGTNPNWPFTTFKMVYGNITEINENKLRMDTSEGNQETVLFDTIPTLLFCSGDKVVKKSVTELRSLLNDNVRIIMFTQRSNNLAIVAYEY